MAVNPDLIKKIRDRIELAKDGSPVALALARLLEKLESVKGEKGDQGEQGDRGDTGYRGPAGPVGKQGPRGGAGARGLTGSEGKQGKEGPQGKQGPLGEQGERGYQGPPGSPDTPDQVVDKVNKAEKKIHASQVEGIPTIERQMPNISLFNRGQGGGGSQRLEVFDEGQSLGQDIQSIDFIGVGVEASRQGTRVVISIQGGGGAAADFADNETPTGAIDGVNTTYALANAPDPADSLRLYLNGQFLTQGVEYTLAADTITFGTPLDAAFAGLPFKAFYRF